MGRSGKQLALPFAEKSAEAPPSSRAPSMRSGHHAQLQTPTVGLRQEVQTRPCTDTQPRPQAPGSACTAR